MSTETISRDSGGIGFCGLLTIVFITLKLTHVIAWSWLWVLAPFWIPVAFVLIVLMFVGAGLLACVVGDVIIKRKRETERRVR